MFGNFTSTTSFNYQQRSNIEELGTDISCNLGSTNINNLMHSPDFGKSVDTMVRGLTYVTDASAIDVVPSIKKGNDLAHTIGLGAMGLHTYFALNEMHYGSPESIEFTDKYFLLLNYYTLVASNRIAKERGVTFENFENSTYATGEYFDKYINEETTFEFERVAAQFEGIHIPTQEDWKALRAAVQEHGLYHQNRLAVAPTGSISYVNETSSSLPIIN